MSDEDERPINLLFLLCILVVDIAFNTAAGAAAVTAGANVNGSHVTDFALRVGAVAGLTKAGVRAFVAFLGQANLGIAAWMLLIVALSKFGIALLVTAQVSTQVLGEVPRELLIAAIVATLPWLAEGFGPVFTCNGSSSYSHSDGYTTTTTTTQGFDLCGILMKYAYIIGWDALVGYTFARMAQNQGMVICTPGAAAAAGGVFGTLSGISVIIAYVCMFIQNRTQTTITYHDRGFGMW